ncbi:MAG: DUF2065 domain-containing protein [Alphaproteobacteria bacterium]|nr:DUF2065 domain-containing protein [Alphaproteobacteria bacterium]
MTELGIAFGLVLVLEGISYALFPEAMRKAVQEVMKLPAEKLRTIGICAALLGLAIVWIFKR